MNNWNRWSSRAVLFAMLCLLLAGSCMMNARASETKAVSGIDGGEFFKAVKCPLIFHYVDEGMQFYRVDAKKYGLKLPNGVAMKFMPTMDEQAVASEMYRREPGEKPLERSTRIGDESKLWFRSDGGTVLFRRNNVVVTFAYKGSLKSAENLALAIDNRLLYNVYRVSGKL